MNSSSSSGLMGNGTIDIVRNIGNVTSNCLKGIACFTSERVEHLIRSLRGRRGARVSCLRLAVVIGWVSMCQTVIHTAGFTDEGHQFPFLAHGK